MNDNTYKLLVYCSNCGFSGDVDIHKGVAVKNYPCPNCGNEGLTRDYQKKQEYIGDGFEY